MQEVINDKLENQSVVSVRDVTENDNKIYCFIENHKLAFLIRYKGKYEWNKLESDSCYSNEYRSIKEALELPLSYDKKTLIFDSQCEFLEYVKNTDI